MLVIRIATKNDKDKIVALRKSSYSESTYLSVAKTSYNDWSVEDDTSILFIIEENNIVVATSRGKIIYNDNEFEKRNHIIKAGVQYPTLLLDQTATETSRQNKGLNTLLRFAVISFAKETNIASISGVVNKDCPRYTSMLLFNYKASGCTLTKDYSDFLHNHTPPILMELGRLNFDEALLSIKNSRAYTDNEHILKI